MLCPFCGEVSPDVKQCRGCRAFLDPLSRQATQNEMGPWYLRDPAHPFRPGCSFETVRRMVTRGAISPMTVIRGPTTRQAWSFAGRVPSVANLLGLCHNCQREVSAEAFSCYACGASFAPEMDRQHLGLAPVHLLPGQAPPEVIASAAAATEVRAPSQRLATPQAASPSSTAVMTAAPYAAITPAQAEVRSAAVLELRSRVARWRLGAAGLLLLAIALTGLVAAMVLGVLPREWLEPASRTAAPSAGSPSGPAPVTSPPSVSDREADAESTEPGEEPKPGPSRPREEPSAAGDAPGGEPPPTHSGPPGAK